MEIKPRRTSRTINLGGLDLGGEAPIRVQSMTNTDTRDVPTTLAQVERLAGAGCEIARVAVPDETAVDALGRIVAAAPTPIIADIHFDHRLALASIRAGAAGVRINPGNLGGTDKLLLVAAEADRTGACLRVGVNSGSLEKELLAKHGRPSPAALVESALNWSDRLEQAGFLNFKVSIKTSDVRDNIEANLLFAEQSQAPLHLGVTEAGPLIPGVVKSSLGIGFILAEGVGETIRVSLTRDPVEEVRTAYEILRALGLRQRGVEIVSCPTCGRTEVDLFGLVEQVETALAHIEEPLKVAVMGCVVNGPGEAREADVGLAGGRGLGMIFAKGERVKKVPEADIVAELVKEVEKAVEQKK